MNIIWLIVLFSSVLCLSFVSPSSVLSSMIVGANKSISLSFELLAIYSVWLGVIGIVQNTKLSSTISKILSPFIDLLWGKNTMTKEAKNFLSLSLSTQLLGVGGASVPFGIKAVEQMDDKSEIITKPMIMTIVFACSGVQLLPTTVMGMMATAGSVNPSYIILPTILSGICTTAVGVILALVIGKSYNKIRQKIENKKSKVESKMEALKNAHMFNQKAVKNER